jgi:hypothetical protein
MATKVYIRRTEPQGFPPKGGGFTLTVLEGDRAGVEQALRKWGVPIVRRGQQYAWSDGTHVTPALVRAALAAAAVEFVEPET